MSDAMTRDFTSTMANARRAASSMTFLKNGAGESQPAPAANDPVAPRPGAAQPSVIAANAEFTGSVVIKGELHVEGVIKGNVRGVSVTVRAGGHVEGDIVAEQVIVHGFVKGRLFGKDVRICAGAEVDGDVRHTSLGIDPGASFEGSVKRVADPIAESEASRA